MPLFKVKRLVVDPPLNSLFVVGPLPARLIPLIWDSQNECTNIVHRVNLWGHCRRNPRESHNFGALSSQTKSLYASVKLVLK